MSVRSIDEGKNIDEGEILKKRTLSIDNYFLFFIYVICKKKQKKSLDLVERMVDVAKDA